MPIPLDKREYASEGFMKDRKFIVAEISKNWLAGAIPDAWIISGLFEEVIDLNLNRGYTLFKFDISRVMISSNCLNETIIAVFEKVGV